MYVIKATNILFLMKTSFTYLFLIAGFLSLTLLTNSCSKADTGSDLPKEQQVVGKWNINRIQLKIYSGGVFKRLEQPSDGPDPDPDQADDGDTAMIDGSSTSSSANRLNHHEMPLHQMQHGETYVVSNVLGVTWIPADVDHLSVQTNDASYTQAASLHNRANSTDGMSFVNIMGRTGASNSSGALTSTPVSSIRKKGVGFAPPPPPYHAKANKTKNAVHLNSTDGLVVVSVFLPVIVKRSDEGAWSAGRP